MLKSNFGALILLFYIVYNHPILFRLPFLHFVYYILIILSGLCELLSYIPCKNHVKYFRRVDGETCMIGIIILPAIASSFSIMWHLNYLSFSILSLIIYLSFNFTKRYLVRIAYLIIIFIVIFVIYVQYTYVMNKSFTFLLFAYHFISLIIFERILNIICIYFSNTFTFSDTIVVSGIIFWIFEQYIVLNIGCFNFFYFFNLEINYFKYRLIIHEYHIVSILIIG
eukprot:373051_1